MASRASRIRIALLGIWIGVAVLFSFVVAPGAFAVLPTTQLAGTLVSRVLTGVEFIGIGVGVLLIAASLLDPAIRRKLSFDLLVVGLLTLAMVISRFFVSARLHALRERYGDQLASLPSDDANRISFDFLHRCSVGLLSFSLFAAVVLLAVLIWRETSRQRDA